MRETVAENVRIAMQRAGLRAIDLAERAKVGRRTVNRLLNQENSTLDTIGAVADALGLEPFELLVKKVRRPLLQGRADGQFSDPAVSFGTDSTKKPVRIKKA